MVVLPPEGENKMGNTPVTPELDIAAIQEEAKKAVANMSPEALQAELLKFRTRQKTQQAKQQNRGSQKKYQKMKNEQFKLMKAEAIRLGIWDKINDEAQKQAEAAVAADTTPEEEDEEAPAAA
jgi:hypothetical protein